MSRTAALWSLFVALAVLVLAMVDAGRPWKRLQVEHAERELVRVEETLEDERQRSAATAALTERLADARLRLAERGDEVARLEDELGAVRVRIRWAEDRRERLGGEGPGNTGRTARRELEEARRAEGEIEARLADLRREVDRLSAELSRETSRVRDLEKRRDELSRRLAWHRLPFLWRIAPGHAIEEVSPPGIFRTTTAGKVPRRDRCATCHRGAVFRETVPREDAVAPPSMDAPAPFAAHPRPDLFLAADSPHPYRRFGCTVCHGGEGRSLDFTRAGHWPDHAAREADWRQRWGYDRADLPGDPMLPTDLIEAGCARCHGDVRWPPNGEGRFERGRQLVDRMGCADCHAVGATALAETTVRTGPPLGRLAVKTTPAWAFHWILAPRRMRSTTWMPHPFPAGDTARGTTLTRAMVTYLWQRAAVLPELPEPPAGDAAEGEALLHRIGCLGCHLMDPTAERATAPVERLHGPHLAGLGDKVSPAWLYAWLRDPRSHRPDTPMPDLRLSEEEAADLVAYLAASRNPAWQDLELPPADPAMQEDLVREYLEAELTLDESEERLARMGETARELYLGEAALEAHGCHGCHDIPGLEDASLPGGSLETAGTGVRQLLEAFAADGPAAMTHGHTDHAAAPEYRPSREEAEAVLVQLLAWRPPEVAPEHRAEAGERSRDLARGRLLLRRYGCLGCHRLDGRGGAIAATLDEAAGQPPDLSFAGARLASPWLFAYLLDPGSTVRRPWVAPRMPTFPLGSGEANDLVRFFAARHEVPLFDTPVDEPSPTDLAVGRTVATLLECQSCHPSSGGDTAAKLSPAELAPSYHDARERLRPQWVVEWILDPRAFVPQTPMPASFTRGADGEPDASFLTALLQAPMFERQLESLRPFFATEEELWAYFEDGERVAAALRDHLFSQGGDTRRGSPRER